MRFLHTADLHLGKRLNDFYLLDDQKHILSQIVSVACERCVDAVLISGDVYQRSSPDSSAMEVFNDFVSELVSNGKKVFIISGNHDSEKRISYFSSLIRSSGVFVSERFEGVLQRVTLEDSIGPLDIYLFPFVKPVSVRRFFPEEEISTFEQMTERILAKTGADLSRRCVLLAHQFITGAEPSDSEELSVGGIDGISEALFEGFDYVALGHIHKPQKTGSDRVLYSGSPLKYSFSEMRGKKSVVIADIGEKGELTVERVPLEPKRELREVKGSLAEVMSMPYSEDLVRVVVTDEFVPPDAPVTVTTVFPNKLDFRVCNSKTQGQNDAVFDVDVKSRSVPELFRDFFVSQTGGTEPDRAHMELLNEILNEMEDVAREAD